jgi:ABC-type sugar transport system ATPase subunit
MRAGRALQCDPPIEVYRRPATVFVGGFVGSPRMNFADGTITGTGDRARLRVFGTILELEGVARPGERPVAFELSGRVPVSLANYAQLRLPSPLGVRR